MVRIPKEILRHRLPGTEIKKIGGHYYIQRITSKRLPGAKCPRKVILGCIGSVSPGGIVPRNVFLNRGELQIFGNPTLC